MEDNLIKKFINKVEEENDFDNEFTVDLCNLQDVYNKPNLLDQMIKYLNFLKNNGLPDVDNNTFILNYHDKGKFLYIYDDTFDVYYIIENSRWKKIRKWDDLIKYFSNGDD